MNSGEDLDQLGLSPILTEEGQSGVGTLEG